MPKQFYWSESKRPKVERVIIRNEPDAEQLLKALEKNPRLYEKLAKKLIERMNEEFDRQLEATINNAEKTDKENAYVKDEIEVKSQEKLLSFEDFVEKYPLEL